MMYKRRNEVERFFRRLKAYRGIATRYDKRDIMFTVYRAARHQENAFYDAHQAEFREKYLDKWLVITGGSLWGVYDKFAKAAKDALKQLGSSEFMIHRPSDDGKVIEIPSAKIRYPDGAKRPKVQRESFCSSGGNPVMFTYPY